MSPRSMSRALEATSQLAPLEFEVLVCCVPSHQSPGLPLPMLVPESWKPEGLNSSKKPPVFKKMRVGALPLNAPP